MRTAGRPSWRIRLDEPQVLAVALRVRDVAGVVQTAAPADLPAVEPRVERDGGPAPPELTAQWDEWWSRALLRAPEALRDLTPPFEAFDGSPALQDVLRRQAEPSLRWAGAVRSTAGATGAPPLTELVAEVERSVGRTARPFDLRIDSVPVSGLGSWRVGDAHLLVSAGLARDAEALAAALRPELVRLV